MCCTTTTGTGRAVPIAVKTRDSAHGPRRRHRRRQPDGARRRRGARRGEHGTRAGRGPGRGGGRAGRPEQPGDLAAVRHEGLDLGDELLGDAGQRLLHAADVRRLRHVVRRTGRQGVQRRGRAALGERGEHDDRQARPRAAQLAHGLDAVHDGHLDVHRHQVRRELLDLGLRDLTVGGGADDVDRGVPGERVGDEASHDDGVVHDQYPDAGHARSVRQRAGAVPATGFSSAAGRCM
jgi:hypothetical protein